MTKKIIFSISVFLILSLSFTMCFANELTTDMNNLGEKTKNATMGITNDIKNGTENMMNDAKTSMDSMINNTKTIEQETTRK